MTPIETTMFSQGTGWDGLVEFSDREIGVREGLEAQNRVGEYPSGLNVQREVEGIVGLVGEGRAIMCLSWLRNIIVLASPAPAAIRSTQPASSTGPIAVHREYPFENLIIHEVAPASAVKGKTRAESPRRRAK